MEQEDDNDPETSQVTNQERITVTTEAESPNISVIDVAGQISDHNALVTSERDKELLDELP